MMLSISLKFSYLQKDKKKGGGEEVNKQLVITEPIDLLLSGTFGSLQFITMATDQNPAGSLDNS